MKSFEKLKMMAWIFVLCFITYITSSSATVANSDDEFAEYNENIYKKYVQMDKQLKDLAEKSVKRMLPYLLEAREHVNVSSTCTRNLFDLITGLRKLTNWSFNFLDAMGKFQSGIQTGNLQMFGEYEECIETNIMKRGKLDFRGEYCLMVCRPYLPRVKRIPGIYSQLEGLVNATRNSTDLMKMLTSRAQAFYAFGINVGLCVPSGCSKQDISEIATYSLKDYINCTIEYCLKDGDIYFWTTTRTIIVCVFIILGLTVIISTWLDSTLESWKNNQMGFKSKILQCFALTRNFPKFMNTDVSEKSITCFNGIRVLTIFWVILGHEFFFHAVSLTANHSSLTLDKMLRNFFSQITFNGFMSVDVFFFISGFVNCYSRILIKQEGKSQPSALKLIAHRLWRIYPSYIIAFLLMYLLSKPQPFSYHLLQLLLGNCNINWWQNILFINNFFTPDKMCMAQSWFLCVDMQLFLLTLFTIPVFLSKPKRAIILHVAILLIVNLCTMSWWFLDDVSPATLDATRLDRNETLKSYYIYTLVPVHLGPYFIGILFGYLLSERKKVKILKATQLFGWLIASFFFLSMLFMTLRWNSGIPYTKLESSLYGAWSRTIMVFGFSWLVYCCATGNGGLINYILSLKLWIPLSRVTYMLYLVSPLIQAHSASHARFPDDFADMRIIWNYFANVSISVLLSIALVLIAESPMIAMEKILFGGRRNENKSSPELPKELTFSNAKDNGFQENGKIATVHL